MGTISKKPKTTALSEKDIDALIQKGGEVPKDEAPAKPKKRSKKKVEKIPVQLRLPSDLISTIDDLIDNRVVRVSRHAWFLEAIAEKIKKESMNE